MSFLSKLFGKSSEKEIEKMPNEKIKNRDYFRKY
jgi:hypothetical protein